MTENKKKIMAFKEICRIENSLYSDSVSVQKNKGKNMKLGTLKDSVFNCKQCKLHKTKTNYVFGTGDPKANLMFIGEAPGKNEDIKGEPFVGRAGKLLNKLLMEIGIERKDVYIANVLKCRPPDNRNPESEEIEKCSPYLKQQVNLIAPKVICALGTFAANFILDNKEGIGKLRNKVHMVDGIKVIPTYHPAYILRNNKEIKKEREDFALIKQELSK